MMTKLQRNERLGLQALVRELQRRFSNGFTFYQNATRDAIQLTLPRGQLTLAPGMPQPGENMLPSA